jgi:asparagine synthetase B (glutamine-hydrolysing)
MYRDRARGAVSALSPLELAAGTVLGAGTPITLPPADGTPAEALEAAVLPALARAPCLVSFSGGRDSSAVLALATRVARRTGLPDPVPATIRVASAPRADERRWQELVVAHLGLRDWHRLELEDELDLVGPVARDVLTRHGLLWPFNAHFHAPMLDAARGGALLTGIGGDELFRGAARPRTVSVLIGRARPRRSDARAFVRDLAPARVRAAWLRRRTAPLPWLTAAGGRAVTAALAAQAAAEPLGLRRRLARLRAMRYLAVGLGALDRLAADAACEIRHPLLDVPVWSAVAAAAPPQGHQSRSAAMERLFGELLPAELLARPDKAGFDEVFMRGPARAFAAAWDGGGVPERLVDPDALRAHWLGPEPAGQSFSLLQAAWVASAGERGEEPLSAVADGVPAARAAEPPDGQ